MMTNRSISSAAPSQVSLCSSSSQDGGSKTQSVATTTFASGKAIRDISVGMEISSILYSFVIIIVIFADITLYEKKLKDIFSSLKNKTLSWLQNLVIALSGLWALWAIPYLYEVFANHFL